MLSLLHREPLGLPLGRVQCQDLVDCGRDRLTAHDPQGLSGAPRLTEGPSGSREAVQAVYDTIRYLTLGDRAEMRADHELDEWQAVRVLLLGELVIGRTAAEACRQHFLDEADEVVAEKGHAF